MREQKVRLVYDLLVPKQFILVIARTFDGSAHLLDHGAAQVAGLRLTSIH